jgi:hypothetical protein
MRIVYCFGSLLVALLALSGFHAGAQIVRDPTEWTFSVQKKDANHYIFTANVKIQSRWHIYAIQPGGDGELIGTSFLFDKGDAKISGAVKEVTPAKQETLMGEKVRLHSDKAVFSAGISGKTGQVVAGVVEYQACNDQMCLPPKKKQFSVKLP